MNDNITINISEDFSETPGARHRTDGDFSGQEFFEDILEIKFNSLKKNEILIIDLDGTDGYATSFLDEAFGGLARKYNKDVVLKKLKFISNEEPFLIDEIKSYINAEEKN
jgi:hypothetical protein